MRPRRRIEFERIMSRQAWTAAELAPKLDMNLTNCRRYLRRYYDYGLLDRAKLGVYMYYAVARFLKPPDGSYPCPVCSGRMDVYHRKCGCTFQLCGVDSSHSRFEYCQKHKAVVRIETKRR